MFEPIQKFFNKAAQKHGISRELKAIEICQFFRELVPELFDEKANPDQSISPAYFKNYTLVINVENPAWAQEVLMRKPKIIEEINKKVGKKIIKNIRAQISTQPPSLGHAEKHGFILR